MDKIKNKVNTKLLVDVAPFLGLIILVIVFAVLTDGTSISAVNIKILTNQMSLTVLVAIGMVFSFSCGALDMSMSGSLCLSAIAGALAGTKTESFIVMIVVTVVVSMFLAVIKGVIAAYLTLPVFIVTIIFSGLLVAIGLVLLGNESNLSVGSIVPQIEMSRIYIIFIAAYYVFALIIFNYTKIGKSCKLQGGNILASSQAGINSKANIITAFLISGMGITLAAIVTILKTKTVTAQTGGTVGTDVLIAIVLGGMPLSGGPRSKISAAIIGSAIITVLNNGLSICNVSSDDIQIVRGVLFLIVVFLTSLSYRTKLLPR